VVVPEVLLSTNNLAPWGLATAVPNVAQAPAPPAINLVQVPAPPVDDPASSVDDPASPVDDPAPLVDEPAPAPDLLGLLANHLMADYMPTG